MKGHRASGVGLTRQSHIANLFQPIWRTNFSDSLSDSFASFACSGPEGRPGGKLVASIPSVMSLSVTI